MRGCETGIFTHVQYSVWPALVIVSSGIASSEETNRVAKSLIGSISSARYSQPTPVHISEGRHRALDQRCSTWLSSMTPAESW
jgi:hypothetical protein